MKEVVLVHSSDVHVDTLADDGTAALAAVVATARAEAADLLLLAGDTFEHNRLPLELLARTAAVIAEAAMPVVILPGNHDPAIPESAFHRGNLARVANLAILGVTHEESVHFPALDLEVWGRAHRDYGNMAPLESPRGRSRRWHVVLAHGHYEPKPDPATALRPSWLISDDEIAATRADYVALGHWNRAAKVGRGEVEAYYSGSPDLEATVNVVRLTPEGRVIVSRKALVSAPT
ncbi:MAG TPA: metallophosphoesterase [Stellaceae bacterium]|nr:metallophosphoesterase [Stellaceae bacterium]